MKISEIPLCKECNKRLKRKESIEIGICLDCQVNDVPDYIPKQQYSKYLHNKYKGIYKEIIDFNTIHEEQI